jgi:hypothetical protein
LKYFKKRDISQNCAIVLPGGRARTTKEPAVNPELLSSLAAEHRRDLSARPRAGDALVPPQADARAPRVPWPSLPSLRVSWSRTTLAAATGRRRGRSVVIIISATRAH